MQTATSPSSVAGSLPAAGPSTAGAPTFTEASFAGLLARIATPQNGEALWNDERLAEDVATISYERALRAHTRVRPASSGMESEPDPLPPSGITALGPDESEAAELARPLPAAPLKTASITIRLSAPECAQLRRRAAEAGLSVSAYLRSCTLEVESLRAQVKETLAELRNPTPKPQDHEVTAETTGGIRDIPARLWNWFRLIGRRRQLALRLNPSNPFAPVRDYSETRVDVS